MIRTFVVHPSFLKMGIGRALMDYSFELAQQLSLIHISNDSFMLFVIRRFGPPVIVSKLYTIIFNLQ